MEHNIDYVSKFRYLQQSNQNMYQENDSHMWKNDYLHAENSA